jgi:hypothetical protein
LDPQKRNLDLPPNLDYNFFCPNKVNYSIPHINTSSIQTRIEEALSNLSLGVAHTTIVLETNYNPREWYIGRLPQRPKKQCQVLQANIKVACKSKVGRDPMAFQSLPTKE